MKTTLGQRIRGLRERMGVQQKDLARMAHMTQAQLSRIEADLRKARAQDVENIARALGVSGGVFYADEIPQPPPAQPEYAIVIEGGASAKEFGRRRKKHPGDSEPKLHFKPHFRAIRVNSDSMSPIAKNGQLAIYDKEQELKMGDICVARITKGKYKGMTVIKRYFEQSGVVALFPVSMAGDALAIRKNHARFYKVIGIWFEG